MNHTPSPQPGDASTEQMIQAKGLVAPRVLPGQINALMDRVEYVYDEVGTSTFCHAFLDGEFFLGTGHSACVSKENFNSEIGRKIARENALVGTRNKLWELEGYALRKQLRGE